MRLSRKALWPRWIFNVIKTCGKNSSLFPVQCNTLLNSFGSWYSFLQQPKSFIVIIFLRLPSVSLDKSRNQSPILDCIEPNLTDRTDQQISRQEGGETILLKSGNIFLAGLRFKLLRVFRTLYFTLLFQFLFQLFDCD